MDGRPSYADDHESRWYGSERGYGEPDWRDPGEDRYRAEGRRAPGQRGSGENRYADLAEPEPGRYGDSGRYGTGDIHGGDRFDSESYGGGRSRRSERAAEVAPLSPADPHVGPGSLDGTDSRGGVDRLVRIEREPRRAALREAPVADRADPVADPLDGDGVDGIGAETSRVGRTGAAERTAGDPSRSSFGSYPIVEPSRSGSAAESSAAPERSAEAAAAHPLDAPAAHPLNVPTGAMPSVPLRPEPTPFGGPPSNHEAFHAGAMAGEGVYRTRRPARAVLLALLAVVFELPALRLLASGVLDDPVSPAHILSGTFLVCGLPIFATGLYGLSTGAVSLTEPARLWFRPPTAYLTVGLALFLAAALAVG